jgi:hypothetical protein
LGQVSQAHTLLLQEWGIGAEVSWHAEFLQHVLEFGTELLRRNLRMVSPKILYGWLCTRHMRPVSPPVQPGQTLLRPFQQLGKERADLAFVTHWLGYKHIQYTTIYAQLPTGRHEAAARPLFVDHWVV